MKEIVDRFASERRGMFPRFPPGIPHGIYPRTSLGLPLVILAKIRPIIFDGIHLTISAVISLRIPLEIHTEFFLRDSSKKFCSVF